VYSKLLSLNLSPVTRAEALYWLGWSHYKEKDYDQALENFDLMLEEFPGYELLDEIYFRKGDIFYEMRKLDEAVIQYEKIADEFPDSGFAPEALYNMGLCFREKGEESKAEETVERLKQKHPKSEAAARVIFDEGVNLQREAEYEGALEKFRQVTQTSALETAARAQKRIGDIYFTQKDYKKSTIEYLKAAYRYSNYKNIAAEARYMAARSKHMEGERDTALKNYEKVIEDFPRTGWAERARNMIEELNRKP
jgi:TolA-binding protein